MATTTTPDPLALLADPLLVTTGNLPNGGSIQGPPAAAGSTSTEYYKGARTDRHTAGWRPGRKSGDEAIAASHDMLTARVRDLVVNDGVMRNALQKLLTLVVGPGINIFAEPLPTGRPADDKRLADWADDLDELWEHWATYEADAEGRLSWPDLQRSAAREMFEAGEALLLRCYDDAPDRSVPLCYQLLETDQLDRSRHGTTAENGNRIAGGVEIDRRNRSAAYYLYDAHPYDAWGRQDSHRVPADRVVHLYYPGRPSQRAGVTWFNPLLQNARDTDLLVGNELTASSLASLFTAVDYYTDSAMTGIDDGSDSGDTYDDDPLVLGRGTVLHRPKGSEFDIIESKRPNRDVAPFIDLLLSLQAMATGISYYRLTGRYDKTSYSAARAAHLDDYAFARPLQDFFARSMVLPVRRQHTATVVGLGLLDHLLTAAEFKRLRRKADQYKTYGAGREQIDPEKETDAAAARCRMGVSNPFIEAGQLGRNFKHVARGMRRALDLCEKLGLSLDFTKQQGAGSAIDASATAEEEAV